VTRDYTDSDLKRILTFSTAGIISILFAGNIFFVARLVSKIDGVIDEVWSLRQQITLLNYRVDELTKQGGK
jgi:hypothetical protein